MPAQLIALFGAGVASFLAPCIVPLLPAYLGIIVGESADDARPPRAVPATVVFVLGFAAVFAGFGAAAGLLGSSLHDVQDGVERVGGVLVAIMGLALLGVIRGPLVARASPRPAPARHVRWARSGRSSSAWRSARRGAHASGRCSPPRSPWPRQRASRPRRGAAARVRVRHRRAVPAGRARPRVVAGDRRAPPARRTDDRTRRGCALLVLGVLLATGTYSHLTSYLARFTPAIGGL